MNTVKAIIAGSRSITDYAIVQAACEEAVVALGVSIDTVISGRAPGIDTLGEQFAANYQLKVLYFPANWNDITVAGALVRTRRDGSSYNVLAGHMRNEEMTVVADVLIACHDGSSTGTLDMIERMRKKNKPVYVKTVKPERR